VDADRGSSVARGAEQARLETDFQVRMSRPGDEDAIIALLASVFPRSRSRELWSWACEQAPDGPADVRVLEFEGRVVGCVVHVPASAWVEGKRLRLGIGGDLAIAPECRGRGGSKLLIQGIHSTAHPFDLNFGVVNPRSSHVTGQYLGTEALGIVPRWTRFRTRGTRRGPLLRAAVSFAERRYGSVASFLRPEIAVRDLELPGPEVDALAHESASFAPCIRVRDAAYLRWHWLEQPGRAWRIRSVRCGDDELAGFCVICAEGRVGRIADLLARDYATLRALLLDAWDCLVAEGCDSVSCLYLDPRPWATRAFIRSGFRRTRDRPTIACGPLSPSTPDIVKRLESWYVTYGDTDI
jgi:N-acetylglutamate synthase-like GNAT family acetyltransferase